MEKLTASTNRRRIESNPTYDCVALRWLCADGVWGQGKNEANLERYQLAEVKHGRLAMIAFSGFVHQVDPHPKFPPSTPQRHRCAFRLALPLARLNGIAIRSNRGRSGRRPTPAGDGPRRPLRRLRLERARGSSRGGRRDTRGGGDGGGGGGGAVLRHEAAGPRAARRLPGHPGSAPPPPFVVFPCPPSTRPLPHPPPPPPFPSPHPRFPLSPLYAPTCLLDRGAPTHVPSGSRPTAR